MYQIIFINFYFLNINILKYFHFTKYIDFLFNNSYFMLECVILYFKDKVFVCTEDMQNINIIYFILKFKSIK